jgi:hypothetical protein
MLGISVRRLGMEEAVLFLVKEECEKVRVPLFWPLRGEFGNLFFFLCGRGGGLFFRTACEEECS